MKTELLLTILPLALAAIIFQFIPLLTRRGIFFSATVDPGFPESPDGRRVLRSFRWQIALWTVLACVLGALLLPVYPQAGVLVPTLLLIAALMVTYWLKFREVHERYGQRRSEVRATSLSPDRAPEHTNLWLVVPPLLALAATAFYLHAHWDLLPERFPVHWGLDGQPNHWASRTWMGVYGPLLMAGFLNLFFAAFAWGLARISRKTVMRYVTIRMLLLLTYPLTFSLVMAALLPLVRLPIWLAPTAILVFVAGLLYWSYRKISTPVGVNEIPEPQNDSYWKAGVFYFNPSDPAIFVSKRVGIGYTMNFANKVSWIVLAGTLLIILLPALLLRAK